MPKLAKRQRLPELETRQRNLGDEIDTVRLPLRSRYTAIVQHVPVEMLTEREPRESIQPSAQLARTAASAASAASAAIKSLLPAHLASKKTAPRRTSAASLSTDHCRLGI